MRVRVLLMKHLLIVGRPGVGKTTLMKRLSQSLHQCAIDGFLTEELREAEQRVGFWLSPLDGRQVLLAHRRFETGYSVGPYKVNVKVLDDVAVPVIQRGRQRAFVLFFDELGRMELCSAKFAAAVQDFPEVVEFYRMSGDVDYLLRIVVPDIAAYDAVYKRLIARVPLSDVSSAFAMETIKYTTALPVTYAH